MSSPDRFGWGQIGRVRSGAASRAAVAGGVQGRSPARHGRYWMDSHPSVSCVVSWSMSMEFDRYCWNAGVAYWSFHCG
ncbi:hypothetical protein GCM10009640_07370 [Agrococcus citreus]|uniref:Uncharacterized protein n=1 Tax=Agrococcus citreus TaxID=84643 RepID=A0ABP4JDU7_9MICO